MEHSTTTVNTPVTSASKVKATAQQLSQALFNMSIIRHTIRRVKAATNQFVRPTTIPTTNASLPMHTPSVPVVSAAVAPMPSPTPVAHLSMRSGPTTPHSPATQSFAQPNYSSYEDGGAFGTKEWRLRMKSAEGKDISMWHDIPLLAQGSSHLQLLFNYINEIPKGSERTATCASASV